jgi:hypothetical protein
VTTGNQWDERTYWDADQRDDKAESDFKQQFVVSTRDCTPGRRDPFQMFTDAQTCSEGKIPPGFAKSGGCMLSETSIRDKQVKDLTDITPYWSHIPSIPIPYQCVNDADDVNEERAQYQSERGDVANSQL